MVKSKRKRKRQSSNPIWIVVAIVALFAVGGGIYLIVKKSSKGNSGASSSQTNDEADNKGGNPKSGNGQAAADLKKTIDELNRKDPNWQLAAMISRRAKIDPAKNGASIALAAAQQLPNEWNQPLRDFPTRRQPPEWIPENDLQTLRTVLQPLSGALGEARKVANYPQGIYPLQCNFKSPIDTTLDYAQQSRKIAQLLLYDANLRSAEQDGTGAAEAALAIARLSSYFEHDPFAICCLVHAAEMFLAIGALERALTCKNVDDSQLETWQQFLEADGARPWLQMAWRGDRASFHAMVIAVAKGDTQWSGNFAGASISDADDAYFLKTMTNAIEVADKPLGTHAAKWQQVTSAVANASEQCRRILPAVEKMRDAFFRSNATIRAAAIGIAAERYRRANGKWPTNLAELEPKWMKKVPVDPFTGGPFRAKVLPSGLAIYCIGEAGTDHGGWFQHIGSLPEQNPGFRVLEPGLRR